MQPFTNIDALIIDMDGVLWHGNHALPGLIEFFKCIRQYKIPYILATNNASLTQSQYVSKLKIMGITLSPDKILTSSMATALYLSEQTDFAPTSIFVVGEEGLRHPLAERGFNLLDSFEKDKPADYVVCGLDRYLIWDKLADASLHLHAGATFIATNSDTTLPTERGPVLGNGAILAALTAATGISPISIGKPEPIMYQQAIKLLGVDPEKTIAIGDRLNTDILGAVNADIRSLMVLTGISTKQDLDSIDYEPTWIMSGLPEIIESLHKIK